MQLVVPLLHSNVSPGWTPCLPSAPTTPSLPWTSELLLAVMLLFRVRWRTSTSTGVSSLCGASMLFECVHESDGSASRTTNRYENGRVEDDKLSSVKTWVPGTEEGAFDTLETIVRTRTFQGVADAKGHWIGRRGSTACFRRWGSEACQQGCVDACAAVLHSFMARARGKPSDRWFARREGVWVCRSETLN